MSDERGETINLAYIGRSLQRLTSEVAGLRDDIKVLTAIMLNYEQTSMQVLEQMTAMAAHNARIIERL